MVAWFTGLPGVSDTQVGAWGVSYGGGETWNGLAAGIPYRAAEVVETWTDLYSALWPQNVSRKGIVTGLGTAVAPRSPLITSYLSDAENSTNMSSIKALADARSAAAHLGSIKTPVYMFQGRVDYAFDVSQASNAYAKVAGPKHLYIGQFGHPPSTFPGPDISYVMAQGVAWYDHYLKGVPNGIDKSKPVTIAAATGARRVSYTALPATKVVGVGFGGTALRRVGPTFHGPLETFGVSLLKVKVARVSSYPHLVAVVFAGNARDHPRRARPETGPEHDQARELRPVLAAGHAPDGAARARRRRGRLRLRREPRRVDLRRPGLPLSARARPGRQPIRRALAPPATKKAREGSASYP